MLVDLVEPPRNGEAKKQSFSFHAWLLRYLAVQNDFKDRLSLNR